MKLKTEFSKMQCLLTGNRFSGVNLFKTRYEFDQQTNHNGITLTLELTVDVDYLEVEDNVKYLQNATIEIAKSQMNLEYLKEVIIEIENELIRRYNTSQVFKFLELKQGADKIKEKDLTERLSRILSDYNNRIR